MTIDIKQILDDHALWLRGDGGAMANLRWDNLSGADLSGANLSGADLSWANLSGANLREDNLRWADLRWAHLNGADLRWAHFSGADLHGANLSGADLHGADLSRADLSEANLSGANLSRANLSGADLRGAVVRHGLTLGRQIGHASRGDTYTFYAFESSAGEPFVFAGRHAMLRSEYEAHIEKEYPNTEKAKATRACLEYVCNLRADFGEDK